MNGYKRYFLSSNSFCGFVSHFKDNYSAIQKDNVYIIKGGPGTGKSSFMKYVALKAKEKGFDVTLCHCTSDPDSLDGVIIEETKTVILDGTSPHTVEPFYPGVCENIIDLGRFWDENRLKQNRTEIINAVNINKALHKTASFYLSVCGELYKDNLHIANRYTDTKKVISFAETLAKKHIPQRIHTSLGNEKIRFIEGVTPKGIMSFPKTVSERINKCIIIKDEIGAVSGKVCEYIRSYALKNGYGIITLKNPFLPDELTDHIIIPSLNLAFLREDGFLSFDTDTRRIHSRRFINSAERSRAKSRISLNNKIKSGLLASAVQTLSKAKLSHDVIESYYIDSMDFDALNREREIFTDRILN